MWSLSPEMTRAVMGLIPVPGRSSLTAFTDPRATPRDKAIAVAFDALSLVGVGAVIEVAGKAAGAAGKAGSAASAGVEALGEAVGAARGGGGLRFHSRYADGTPVMAGQQPPRLSGPAPNAQGAHSAVRWDSVNNRVYQAREFDGANNPIRDIDFISPTYPNGALRPDHALAPHQHPWIVNNPSVGPRSGFRRGPGESLP
ncbi:hypothetical protein WMF30_49975 [Sorangium sp. So ce134]